MEKFRLSVDSFAEALGDDVAYVDLRTEREPTIERIEVYDSSTYFLGRDCIYICLDGDFPPCKHVQHGTAIVVDSPETGCKDGSCDRHDVIALHGMDSKQVFNKVCKAMASYMDSSRKVEVAANSGDAQLQQMLDAAEELLGYPVCIMDVNQDIVAASDHKELFANPLWETIARNDKSSRCELLNAFVPQLHPQIGGPALRDVSESSALGWHVLTHVLMKRNRPIGSFWAFSTKPDSPFTHSERCLFDWLSSCVQDWAERSSLFQTGRGLKKERLLVDLLYGVFEDEAAAEVAVRAQDAVEILKENHQLVAIRPGDEASMADEQLHILEDLERILPEAVCALSDGTAFALVGMDDAFELPESQQTALESLCVRRNCIGAVGTAYFNLCDTPKAMALLANLLASLEEQGKDCGLYFYHDFLVQQTMHMVLESQPHETLFHPMVRRLMDYDEQNRTDYLETLKVYLNNRCNVTATAQQLGMHRNTLLHRVKRLEDLLGNELESWTLRRTLLLSLDYLYLDDERQI